MKITKIFTLLPILLAVIGCNIRGSYAGKYSFQLGTTEGTHAAIFMELEDTPYEGENSEIKALNAKKFNLTFDINGLSLTNSSSEETEEATNEEVSNEEESSKEKQIIDFKKLSGYYYTANEQTKAGEILHLGIELLDMIDIPPELTELILYATVSSSSIDILVPVSFDDLFFQLYWYGYRIASIEDVFDPTNILEENPDFIPLFENNKPGTHPSKEAIEAIKTYQEKRSKEKPEGYQENEDMFIKYRDFHTLNMGLKKNG